MSKTVNMKQRNLDVIFHALGIFSIAFSTASVEVKNRLSQGRHIVCFGYVCITWGAKIFQAIVRIRIRIDYWWNTETTIIHQDLWLGKLVPSSHQRSEFSNTILCNFSRWDRRIWNRTEQNFIGNYKAPATPRWHKSKPYKYKDTRNIQNTYMYNIHSREFKCRFINNISKSEGKSVCLNGSLFYHKNLFIIILTNFARFERTFLFVLVINDLNFSILGLWQ